MRILLLVIFLSVAKSQDGRLSYSGEACQGQTLAMECPEGYTMTFTEAFYGRDDPNYCKGDDPEMNKVTNCSQPDVLDAVKAICDGRTICDLEVDNQNLGGNPCRDVPKFLVVRFYCAEALLTGLQCEGNQLTLECPSNYHIQISTAFYGRQDARTCSHESAILSTNCSSTTSLSKVSQLCQSKRICDVYAFSSLLGDPCEGTFKYLEVAFSCFSCVNQYGDDLQCDEWADQEECDVNPDWMFAFCRKSCTRCDYQQSCNNIYPDDYDCDYWAGTGECVINPYWMSTNCMKSCNKCPLEPTVSTTAAPNDVTTVLTTPYIPVITCMNDIQTTKSPDDASVMTLPSVLPKFQEWEDENCYNVYEDTACNYWAQIKECHANPIWMAKNCAKACGVCTPDEPDLCANVERDELCDVWATYGECRYNPHFMLVNCRMSCGLCTNLTEDCVNIESEIVCQYYANVGECLDNSAFMMEFCKVSCGFCESSVPRTTLPPHVACLNTYGNNTQCDIWASQGECVFNADWMEVRCGLSCGKCVTAPHGPCINRHHDVRDCVHWAKNGRCETSAWMKEFCPIECGLCTPDPISTPSPPPGSPIPYPCVNRNPNTTFCEQWVEDGLCHLEFEQNTRDCRRSCKMCDPSTDGVDSQLVCETDTIFLQCGQTEGLRIYEAFFGRRDIAECPHDSVDTDDCPSHWSVTGNVQITCQGRQFCDVSAHSEVFTDPCPGTFKYLEIKYECQECINVHGDDDDCNLWAEQGECETNAFWMADNCFKACSRCDVSECSNAMGDDTSCDYWAMRNECDINSEWMRYNCKESCRECTEEIPRTAKSTTSTEAISSASYGPSTSSPQYIFSGIACEGEVLSLVCPMTEGISVTSAFYGRRDLDACPDGVPSDADLLCSSSTILDDLRRECSGVSNCQVHILPNFLGDPCPGLLKYVEAEHKCMALSEFDCSPSCGDHGICITGNKCICQKGYSGEYCDEVSCEGENNCNGRGTCIGPNQCMCDDGWAGPNCNHPNCSAVNDCSQHGICVSPGKCWCYPYFSGDDCGTCFVGFQTGASCLPCPNCINGECIQDDTESTGSYLGCYRDVAGNRDLSLLVWIGEETNTVSCMQRCHARGFKYAGLQDGDTCFCGNSYGAHGASRDCFVHCNAGQDGEICGGRLANSVWKVHDGHCKCNSPNWSGMLCDECSEGYSGANCFPLSTLSKPISPSSSSQSSSTISSPSSTMQTSPSTSPSSTSSPSSSTAISSAAATHQPTSIHPTNDNITDITLSVILDTPWKDVYHNLNDPATSSIVNKVLPPMRSYLESRDPSFIDLQAEKLSPLPTIANILMTTVALYSEEIQEVDTFSAQLMCDFSQALEDGTVEGITEIKAHISTQQENLCTEMASYCGDHGDLTAASVDNSTWTCSCRDGYSGRQCQYSEWDTTKAIIISVVCTVGPLLTILVLCLVLRHKRFMKLPFSRNSDTVNSFRYQDMNRARKSTSRKLFQMQRTDENADDDGFTPRQI